MKLNELTTNPGSTKRRKRIGRGDSSGWGKTAGRGEKGQKSRTGSTIRPFFEGGQIPLFRRLPKRGFKSLAPVNYQVINLNLIEEHFNAGDVIDIEVLRGKKLLNKSDLMLKVLANGELTKAVTVKADKFSAAAALKIEKAGGKAVVIECGCCCGCCEDEGKADEGK